MAPADVAQRAQAVRSSAVTALTELANGASLCTIARSGTPFPGGKYHEGRAFVAGEVLRGIGAGRSGHDALAAARLRWELVAPPGRTGDAEWAAYREGGLDALAELAG